MTRKNSVSKLTSFWFFFLFFTFLSSFIMSLRKRKMSCCHPLQQYGEENRVIFKLILIKLMTMWAFGLHWIKKPTFLKILSEKHFLCLHRQLSTQDSKHFRSNKSHTSRNSWTEYNSCGRWPYHVSSDWQTCGSHLEPNWGRSVILLECYFIKEGISYDPKPSPWIKQSSLNFYQHNHSYSIITSNYY